MANPNPQDLKQYAQPNIQDDFFKPHSHGYHSPMHNLNTRYAQPAPPPTGLNNTPTPPGVNGHQLRFAPQFLPGDTMTTSPPHATGGFTPPPMANKFSHNGPQVPMNPANHVQATGGPLYSSPVQQRNSLQNASQSFYSYSQPTTPLYNANTNSHMGMQSSHLPIHPPGHQVPQNNLPTVPPTSNFSHGSVLRPPPLPGQQLTSQLEPPKPTVGFPITSGPPLMRSPGELPPLQGTPGAFQNIPGPIPVQRAPGDFANISGPPPMHKLAGSFPNTFAPRQIQPGAGPVQPMYNSLHNSGYPPNLIHGMNNLNVYDENRPVDLMQEKRSLPETKTFADPLRFESGPQDVGLVPPHRKNCSPELFRCTLNAIPNTQAMQTKLKLPFGLIIHPFKDLSSLPVISAGTIVRCKHCRTYVNPFVTFLNERRWKCNLCFIVNDVPEEFLHHPVTKTYGQPHTRPECTNSTLEFIAPQEYMVRPPQPAVYLFLFDVSHAAMETGYLDIVCQVLLENLENLPGDSRTRIGFLSYSGTIHFYRMAEMLSQPQMLVVSDIDDVFIPTMDGLLVNLQERKQIVRDLLCQLPELHTTKEHTSYEEIKSLSALGAALQVAQKLVSASGGRVTVFQQSLPSVGPAALKNREDPNTRAGEQSTEFLNPSTDFYKKIALECSAHQVAIDFFFMNSHYIDIATLSCASRFSAGDVHYYPGLHTTHNPLEAERLARDLDRYLTRKIGFEAVMRIRCTKGIGIHTFHGNFFVRSTDLLALANINPDAGFGLNLSIEESLTDLSSVCFQAALLYTSSRGERRIRVHTLCFPIAKTPADVFNSIDSDAVLSLLSKMAVDRSITSSIQDSRDALINALIDPLKVYKQTILNSASAAAADSALLVPPCMKTFPLYLSCLLKHPAFRSGVSTKLDQRVFEMISLKTQPTMYTLQSIHPDLYRVDNLTEEGGIDVEEIVVPQPPLLTLSAESIYQHGAYLLDVGWKFYLYVGSRTDTSFINNVLGLKQYNDIYEPMYSLPDLDNPQADNFHKFIDWLRDQRPHYAPLQVIREDSRDRYQVIMYLRQDRTESAMSFQEFLQHVQQQIKK